MQKVKTPMSDKMIWLLLILAAISLAFLLCTVNQMKTEPNEPSATQDSITRYCPVTTKNRKSGLTQIAVKDSLLISVSDINHNHHTQVPIPVKVPTNSGATSPGVPLKVPGLNRTDIIS